MTWWEDKPTDPEEVNPRIAMITGENYERGCLCPRKPIVCAVYRTGAIVAALFQSMIAYVRSVGR
jgi:hypothetical protein